MINFVNADCIEAMSKLSDKSVDLVVTDIPYGEVNRKSAGLRNLDKGKADIVTFNLSELVDELCRLTKGSIYIYSVVQNKYQKFVKEWLKIRCQLDFVFGKRLIHRL